MNIHRCRFVEYPPPSINALAFSHGSGSTSGSQPLRLAIGRANGDIEIWDPHRGLWLHETTLRGGKDRSIEGLAWIQDPDQVDDGGHIMFGRSRLFSIGYSTAVTEWDLTSGLPLRESAGGNSEIWCIAAQPKVSQCERQGAESVVEETRRDLVAGCADGTILLLSTAGDDLTFSRYIARASRKNARTLSIAFQNRHTAVCGFADSSMRVYDIRSGSLLRTISIGSGGPNAPKETLVWTVQCLSDGTIASGDSNGELCFWDAKNYSQLQRIKAHDADVLCLAASVDGRRLMSGGMDRKTVIYTALTESEHGKRWSIASHRTSHQHDVKAMASFENKKLSIVVSGGIDATPIVNPLREYANEQHRSIPYIPQPAPITGSRRFVVSWWGNEVRVWRIRCRKQLDGDVQSAPAQNHRLVSLIRLQGDESISTADISSTGSLLAVATSAETKLFQLHPDPTSPRGVRVRKVELPGIMSQRGSRIVQFASDEKWYLSISQHNQISLAGITLGEDGSVKVHSTPASPPRWRRPKGTQNCLNGTWGSYDRTIIRAAFSADSTILAVADLTGYIDTWILVSADGNSDSPVSSDDSNSEASDDDDDDDDDDALASQNHSIFGARWSQYSAGEMIPKLPSQPLIFTFRPNTSQPRTEDRLFVLTATHEIYEIATLSGRISDWSRRNTVSNLPAQFRLQRDRAVGHIWDVTAGEHSRQRIWIHGASWLCMFDLAQDMPIPPAKTDESSMQVLPTSKKRKRTEKINEKMQRNIESKKGNTGAGSRLVLGLPEYKVGEQTVLKTDEDGVMEWMPENDEQRNAEANRSLSDEEDIDGIDGLPARRTVTDNKAITNGSVEVAQPNDPASKNTAFYLTNRYRPILGVVSLTGDSDDDEVDGDARLLSDTTNLADDEDVLEVALVERPFWDLDLPPPFVGKRDKTHS